MSKKNNFELLDWDSNFFGYPVARISFMPPDPCGFEMLINQLKDANVRLAYYISKEALPAEITKLADCTLANIRVVYEQSLMLGMNEDPVMPLGLSEYLGTTPTPDLERLAIECGIFSRFNEDKKIPKKIYEGVFKEWLKNSLNKTFADGTYVVNVGGSIAGFVTVSKHDDKGCIGLIAVDKAHRGKGVGLTLVNGALWWARTQNLPIAQVITQGANSAAQRLYERCGYQKTHTEHFYHIWL